ncbi:MAG: alpha/beta fold hydrolase [Planctomycetes bacterium]|nr:alpha/beta fold hydrolase [Planctomycetota bacterium]
MVDELRNTFGERLDHTLTLGSTDESPLVVIGHGVTANKDRPFLQALSTALAAVGIASLRFSFSGNGDSEGRFEDSTVSKEVQDLGCVLDAFNGLDRPLAYAGHSMGAAVGVLRAASDTRISVLVSLAGMVHTKDFAQRKFGGQRPGDSLMWDKPECPLSQAWVDDMAKIDTVVELGAEIHVPWLLVHGDADTVVPLRDAEDIRSKALDRPELVVLEGVDHVFADSGTERMTRAVVPFFERVFGHR